MKASKVLIGALLALGLIVSSFGDHHKQGEKTTMFQEVFLATYGGETDKLISLAEAFSEEGFEWRPADGIRSVRESVLHVASANYFLISKLGGEAPEGLKPRAFEKEITDRDQAIALLKQSIQVAKATVKGLSEAQLAEVVNFFGNESPKMAVVMTLNGHASEHLGQLIAYARSSGVVPPWSM